MRWFWLDRYTEFVTGSHATALKCVSLSEDHLQEHWPSYPIMPNTLIAEGMAQCGGLLVSEIYQFSELVVLAKFARCSIEGEARPGDTIRYHAKIEHVKDFGASVTVKIRSMSTPAAARIAFDDEGATVTFDTPQFGVAPGQACVVYQGSRVLGGGWIRRQAESPATQASAA